MKLLEFIEDNDWEGEEWSFYVWMDSETESKLRALLENNPECPYSLVDEEYTEEEVKKLMRRKSKTTYMNQHNLCGILTLPEIINLEENDPFYKGGIESMCKPRIVQQGQEG